MKYCGKIW